jgi:outer membrane protein assembly factor BamB
VRAGPSVLARLGTLFGLVAAILVVPSGPAVAAIPSGNQLKLDGSDDYATIADNATLDIGDTDGEDFTVETFFYVDNTNKTENENDILFSKGPAPRGNVVFRSLSTDTIVFRLSSTLTLSNSTNITDGWHHIAFVYDNEWSPTNDRFAIFYDGAEFAVGTAVDFDPGFPNNSSPLDVGALAGASGWDDWIEEFRVSDTVRYPEGSPYTVPGDPFTTDANTRALWHFDETACSTSFADSSGNGNTLTGQNGAMAGVFGATAPTLQLSTDSYSVDEGNGSATITVTRAGDPVPVVGVNHTTSDGTATAGLDYTDSDGTLSFACGDMAETFNVPVTADAEVESDETVTLGLDTPTGGASLGTPSAATLTIVDQDTVTPEVSWPMYGRDPTHSAASAESAPSSLPDPEWSFDLNVEASGNASPVVGPDGTIYVPSRLGFFAVNPNGTQKWKRWGSDAFDFTFTEMAPAVADDGTVYVVKDSSTDELFWPDDALYALDPDDGSTLWTFVIGRGTYGSPTIGPDGTIYIGSAKSGVNNSVFAINPNGTEKWRWDSGSSCSIETSPGLGPNGEVYVVHNCLGLVALDSSGDLLWNRADLGDAWNSPSVGPDGTVYIADSSDFHALDPDNGSTLWQIETSSFMYLASAAIAPDGNAIYRGDNGGVFYAFRSTGSVKWQYDTGIPGPISSAPALAANGVVYFTQEWSTDVEPDDKGYIYALRATDGMLLWQREIGFSSHSAAIGADGTLYALADGASPETQIARSACAGSTWAGAAPGRICCRWWRTWAASTPNLPLPRSSPRGPA